MLPGHEEGCEHMGNLAVGDSAPVFILLSAKGSHHVAFVLETSEENE